MLKVGSLLSEYASIRRWTFAAHLIRFVRKHTCVPEWSFNCVVKVQTKHNYPAMVVLALRKSNTWPRGRGVANETWRPFEFCYGCGLLGPHLTLPSWHLTSDTWQAESWFELTAGQYFIESDVQKLHVRDRPGSRKETSLLFCTQLPSTFVAVIIFIFKVK